MRQWTLLSLTLLLIAAGAVADDSGVYSISGVPLYIDGNLSQARPLKLAPELLDQVRQVRTLGDALRILGPSYITPGDSMRIPHWHFQDGQMLTLWPQGGETLTDSVSVYPRPDCGVPSDQCKDLVLGRKKGQGQKHGGSGGGGGGSPGLGSLMHMMR